MIVHIVFFKLKEQNKDANLRRLQSAIEGMKGKVEVLRDLEVGIDFNGSERACDLSLYSTFDSKTDLKTYATHPEHLKVIEIVKEVSEYTKVVDYEK